MTVTVNVAGSRTPSVPKMKVPAGGGSGAAKKIIPLASIGLPANRLNVSKSNTCVGVGMGTMRCRFTVGGIGTVRHQQRVQGWGAHLK